MTLFVNGAPLQVDRFPPYEFEWPTGAAGYYDIFFEVLDNQGNRNVSSVMRREVFYSEAPQFDFQPASPAIVSANLDTNGSWEKETISISYSGTGYHVPHQVVFFDPQQSGDGASGYAMISNGKVSDVQITSEGTGYSQNSEIRLVGGLSTALKPIRMELGKTLPLGIYAYDPDSMINPLGFVLDINGEEMDTVITGSDPNFSFLWTPMVPGDYDLRVRGSSVDGTEAFTANLDIEVFNDSRNSVTLLANAVLDQPFQAVGNPLTLPFQIDSVLGTVEEIRVFDNGVEVASYPANQRNNLTYEPGTGFFNFSWVPNYTGAHEILVSVKLQNGVYVFSEAHTFEAEKGINILISSSSQALNTEPYPFLLHDQCTKIGVQVEVGRGHAPELSQAFLYGNEILLAHTVFPPNFEYEYNSLGFSNNRVAWNFDWNVSFQDFVDLPVDGNSSVQIDLKVIAVTRADMSMGIHGQELISESVPVYLRVLDINDPISSIALYYLAVTGERLCDVRDLYPDLEDAPDFDANGTIDNNTTDRVDDTDVVGDIVESISNEDYVDLIGAQVVLYGSYHDDANDFFDEWEKYNQEFNRDLNSYIINEFESSDRGERSYISLYGHIYNDRNQFLGAREGDYYSNRVAFVNRHYRNKYGRLPFTTQSRSGANKIWASRDLGNVGVAADFIFNLVREPTIPGTIGGLQTYLPNMASHRGIYLSKAQTYLAIKNASTEDANDTNQLRVGKVDFQNLSEASEYVVQSSYIRQKFNLLWDDSETSDISANWKHEDWFGWFTDEAYPWIYHVDLGWLYSNSNSQNNIWLYSESMGWFWTSREIFKDHSNLTATNQRFIYRVRPQAGGGWEGSWSLLVLPGTGNDSGTIEVYDYGYYSF